MTRVGFILFLALIDLHMKHKMPQYFQISFDPSRFEEKLKNCAKKSLGKRVLTSIVLKARGVQLHLRLLPTLKIHSDSLSFMLF